ncbi:hypothetical protein TWF718_010849 [Orbilia javanica]|uniref:Uncharacterized protein n=1 Tax=Orbilia javanica TaxID=47235 RepID=A0AAN8MK97_9PEZI
MIYPLIRKTEHNIKTYPLKNEALVEKFPGSHLEQISNSENRLGARAPPEIPLIGQGLQAEMRFDIIRGIMLLREVEEDLYAEDDFKSSRAFSGALLRSTKVSPHNDPGGDEKRNSMQALNAFLEAIERPGIVTDKESYLLLDVEPDDITRSPSQCMYSPTDRVLLFVPLSPILDPDLSSMGNSIYGCWHYASITAQAKGSDSKWPPGPKYLVISGIEDDDGLLAIQRISSLWHARKMGNKLEHGCGFSISRTDANPHLASKEPEDYPGLNIYDAAWAILQQPLRVRASVGSLLTFQWAMSRLQISNIRFALYNKDRKIASQADLDEHPNEISQAVVFLELERRPGEMPDGANNGSPNGDEKDPDEIMEDIDQVEAEYSYGPGSVSPIGGIPFRIGSPITSMQLESGASGIDAPVHNPLGPGASPSYTMHDEPPPTYYQRDIQYMPEILFKVYSSMLQDTLVIFSTITTAQPPEAVVPPEKFANVIRSIWIDSVGESKLRSIAFGNLSPKAEDALEDLREKWGKGNAPSFMSEGSLFASAYDGDVQRYNSILARIAEFWEGASVLYLIAMDEGLLGINNIVSVKYGPSVGGVDEDAKFLSFELSDELQTVAGNLDQPGSPSVSEPISPPPSDNIDDSPRKTPSKLGDTSIGSTLDLPELIAFSLEQGARIRAEYFTPYSYYANNGELASPIQELDELNAKYHRKSFGIVKPGGGNQYLNHEEAIEDFTRLGVRRDIGQLGFAVKDFQARSRATYELGRYSSAPSELSSDDEQGPSFAYSAETRHMIMLEEPDFGPPGQRSSSLRNILLLEAIRSKGRFDPRKSGKVSRPINWITFLQVSQRSRRIIEYLFELTGEPRTVKSELRLLDFFMPTFQASAKIYGSRINKHSVKRRLAWLVALALPEIADFVQYAAEVLFFMDANWNSLSNTGTPVWIGNMIFMSIRWVRLSEDLPEELIPEIFAGLADPADDPRPKIWQQRGMDLPIIRSHLKTGERVAMQDLCRQALPSSTRRGNPPAGDWVGRIDSSEIGRFNSDDWKRSSNNGHLTNWPQPVTTADIPITLFMMAADAEGRELYLRRDPAIWGLDPKELQRKIMSKVIVKHKKEDISFEALVDKSGELMLFNPGFQAPGDLEEGIKKLAPAVYTSWYVASKGTDATTTIKSPKYVAILNVSKRTVTLLHRLAVELGFQNPAKFMDDEKMFKSFPSQSLYVHGDTLAGDRASRTTGTELLFSALCGIPEVGAVLQAFQDYWNEMGTHRSFVVDISLRLPGPKGARAVTPMILIRFGNRV